MRKASLVTVFLLMFAFASANEQQDNSALPSFLFESVYKIEKEFRRGPNIVLGQATCFAVDLSAYGYSGKRVVITAGHVTQNERNEVPIETRIRIRDGTEFVWITATVLAFDISRDLALLLLDRDLDSVAKLAKKDNIKRGDKLFAVGSPGGSALTPTPGYLASKEREIEGMKEGWWQASFPISPGNSGGPVWDPNRKEIVGVLTGGQTSFYGISPNVGFFASFPSLEKFLKSDVVKAELEKLEKSEKLEKKQPKPKSVLSEKAKAAFSHGNLP